MASLVLAAVLAAAPAPADAAVSDAVIIALNSVKLDRDAEVVGDLVVNDAATAPTLEPGFELSVDKDAQVQGSLRADSIDLDKGVTIGGTVECNDGVGTTCAGVALPVFEPLPPFRAAVPADGSGANCEPGGDCHVASGTVPLEPGAYRDIRVAPGATVELSQGGYDAASFSGGNIAFTGVSQLRVAGDFFMAQGASLTAGAGLSGQDLIVYVGGNADFGKNAAVEANFHVAGRLHMDRDSSLSGSVIAFDADFDKNADLDLDSAFNLAPTADPQTVTTSGGTAVITLTGSDPDGDPLAFSIVQLPTAGTLTDADGNAVVLGQPLPGPTVTYSGADDTADLFFFQVDDGKGGSDVAQVDINPSDDPPEPPVLPGIVAKDDSLEVDKGATNVPIVLVAAAPIDPDPDAVGDLTFAITSPPDQGGSLTTPVAVPGTPVRSARAEYSPLGEFTGTETFTFEACEAADPNNCDQATVTIDVQLFSSPAAPVAVPQSVTLTEGTEIEINLAVPIGAQEPTGESGREGCGNGELDPGEECDDGNLLNGDGCDDQCMSEPQG